MHIGCDVDILLNGKVVHQAVNFGAVIGKDSVLVSIGETARYSDGNFEIKLILRPLSSITDEEVFEAFKAAGIYGLDIFRDADKIGVVGMNGVSAVMWVKTSSMPVGRFLEAWNNFPHKSQPECFEYMFVDYLRSKNFALPFMGMSVEQLIADGWIILQE